MGSQMSNRLRIGLIAAILAVVAVIAIFGALILIQGHPAYFQRNVTSHMIVPGDLELFYVINTMFSTVNIALSIILISIYGNLYTKTRSAFTIGLLIFALVLLVRNLASSPFVTSLMGYHAYGLGPFAFLPSLFELVGLSVLLYLSIKY